MPCVRGAPIRAAESSMIHAKDVIRIYESLTTNGIQVWLTGGWGIDALLGEQTRPHKDLDIIILMEDIVRVCDLLGGDGFTLKEHWGENRWLVDAHGTMIPTAFVLQDAQNREVDVHAIQLDDQGSGVPAWADDRELTLSRGDLAGDGMIDSLAVRCFSPEIQMLCHTGYDLPEEQLRDLEQLNKVLLVKLPD